MKRSDFTYHLPPELIASHPVTPRSASRLLHVADDGLHDRTILDLPSLLRAGDLIVFNDTKVIKARLIGAKPTGGRCEVLVERVVSDREVLAQLGVSKKPAVGGEIIVADGRFVLLGRGSDSPSISGAVAAQAAAPAPTVPDAVSPPRREDDLFHLQWHGPDSVWALMERAGALPLPPYIERTPDAEDETRYQTVFADKPGAVAAPTASLHFDEDLLAALAARGVGSAKVTLHVGAGTFQPLRVENLEDHVMHAERYEVPAGTAAAIAQTRAQGGRVLAVGTTVCRALESAFADGGAPSGDTRLFITPGYRFRAVDLLLTNTHLPESTLLMLVCAFGGYERLMAAYRHAVTQRYRFFSYGDAMLIEPQTAFGK